MKIPVERLKKERKIVVEYEDDQFSHKDALLTNRIVTKNFLSIRITISWVDENNVYLKGDLYGNFIFLCDRCNEEFERYSKFNIDECFSLDEEERIEKEINLDKKIREIVLDSFPIKILCKEDCKGICLGCKVNLNKEECKCPTKK